LIYLDNATTSYPKPPRVLARAAEVLSHAPPASGMGETSTAPGVLGECRGRLARLFGLCDPQRVVLAPSATHALSYALHGLVRSFPSHPVRCLSSVLEHRSVLAPLQRLQSEGWIQVDYLSAEELLSNVAVENRLSSHTELVALTAASNVTGQAPDLVGIGRLCRQRGAALLIDAAQAAGCIPLDLSLLPERTLIAVAGHKSLYGPPGTGALLSGEGFGETELPALLDGGGGEGDEIQGDSSGIPERFEAGTLNLPGFAGLSEGVAFVQEQGLDSLGKHRHHLITQLIDQLCEIPGLRCYGAPDADYRCGLLSFSLDAWDAHELSQALYEAFSIRVRGGLHGAPLMHRSLGCPSGSLRVSVGFDNSEEEITRLSEAVSQASRRQTVAA